MRVWVLWCMMVVVPCGATAQSKPAVRHGSAPSVRVSPVPLPPRVGKSRVPSLPRPVQGVSGGASSSVFAHPGSGSVLITARARVVGIVEVGEDASGQPYYIGTDDDPINVLVDPTPLVDEAGNTFFVSLSHELIEERVRAGIAELLRRKELAKTSRKKERR